MNIEELENMLSPFSRIRMRNAHPQKLDRLIRHLNSGKAEIGHNIHGHPICLVQFAAVNVLYRASDSLTLHLRLVADHSEASRLGEFLCDRPDIGVNVKMHTQETPRHAAHRALKEKIGISKVSELVPMGPLNDVVTNSTGIPGLITKRVIHLFLYYMPADQYNVHGYVFQKEKDKGPGGKKTIFQWNPSVKTR